MPIELSLFMYLFTVLISGSNVKHTVILHYTARSILHLNRYRDVITGQIWCTLTMCDNDDDIQKIPGRPPCEVIHILRPQCSSYKVITT